jgi:uncharacterized delta-60 repeat protein
MRPGRRSAFRGRFILAVAVSALLLLWGFPTIHAEDGALDTSFDGDGMLDGDLGRNEIIRAVALQPDGKIVCIGAMESKKKGYDFVLARLLPEGDLDEQFGDEGLNGLDFFGGEDVAYALAIQPDGKIVVAGEAANPATNSSDFALARFNSNGSIDQSFGSDGTVVTDFSGRAEHIFALVLQPDGKIVAAGFTEGDTNDDFALARYNSDGTLDMSFGAGGKLHTDFLNNRDVGYALAIQPDGKIVAGGVASGNFGLARYNSDGSLDPSFGYSQNGKVNIDFATHNDLAYAIILQPDGKIVVGGYAFNQGNTDADFALARLESNGTLDPSFGTGGRITTDFSGGLDSACAVRLQPDGKILASGYATGASGKDFALARYSNDGSLDTTFGTLGKTSTDFFGLDDWAWGMALSPTGRAVVVGYATTDENEDFAIACYRAFTVSPEITGVERSGKKLFVYGKNFDNGAELLMNGEKQKKTFNDELNPTTMLTAKKTGKKIAPGQTVMLQVRNRDGRLSNEFSYTRPLD